MRGVSSLVRAALDCPEKATSFGRPEEATSFGRPEEGTSFGRTRVLAGDAVVSIFPTRSRTKASPASRLLPVLCLLLLTLSGVLHAQAIEALPFADRAQEVRFQQLTAQLRCPMCQNETLADSNAPIARDLRHQVFALMQQGRSDTQIKQYLVDRYSDYVLYDPPVKPGTWLLWFGPLAILLSGAALVLLTIRRRSRAGTPLQGGSHGTPAGEDDW